MQALFEGLACIDEAKGRPVPAVAEAWETGPDGLSWTFHIGANARLSNGDPLTASDFVYSFHRILSPKFAAGYSYTLWPIRNAQAFNEGKVTDFSEVGVHATD